MATVRAANGFDTYRYTTQFGVITIGANSTEEALREASRSFSRGEEFEIARLQRWNGEQWEQAA